MTVALISVATRYNDHGAQRATGRTHHVGPSASPSAGGTSGAGAPSQTPSSQTPSSQPSTSQPPPTSGHKSSGNAADGAGQGEGGVATLPNTGNSTQTIELAALAMLLIAGGSLGVRISRPKQGQSASLVAATQSAQAAGSAASNRPGTC